MSRALAAAALVGALAGAVAYVGASVIARAVDDMHEAINR